MENHIFQLLHIHECVVVPQFGAFVLRYYPAEFQEGTMLFRPPSRRVCFQPELKENDGLLVHQIAKVNSVSYREAERTIAREVKNWKNLLQSGHSVSLPGIGKIYSIKGSTYEFFPELNSNFMRDSYGLQIIRAAGSAKVSVATEELPVVKELQHVSPWGKRIFRAAAVMIPVLIAINITTTSPKQTMSSVYDAAMSILPAKVESVGQVEIVQDQSEKAEIVEAEIPVAIEIPEPVENELLPLEESIPVKDDNQSLESSTIKYHIIVGAFGDINNARKHQEVIQSKGFSSSVISGNSKLNRVSAGGYTNLQDAEEALQKVKSTLESGAWLLTL